MEGFDLGAFQPEAHISKDAPWSGDASVQCPTIKTFRDLGYD